MLFQQMQLEAGCNLNHSDGQVSCRVGDPCDSEIEVELKLASRKPSKFVNLKPLNLLRCTCTFCFALTLRVNSTIEQAPI